jgi:uncharacterized protein YndB with AHSA1/START domain
MAIITIIIIILAVPFILALFQKNESYIEREITVNKPKQDVFNYVKHLKNGEQYNKWIMADPDMKKTFSGNDGNAGFVYAWESADNNVGKGEQEITKVNEGERVESEVRFEKPFKGVSFVTFITEPVSTDKTKVRWVFSGPKNYMMKVMHVVLNIEKKLGNDLQVSLGNLKTILEK